jgi:transposase
MATIEVFMGSNRQYTDEFRNEAVKQVIERGFTVVDVASRIGIPKHTLYEWVHKARKKAPAVGGASERRSTRPRCAGSRPSSSG